MQLLNVQLWSLSIHCLLTTEMSQDEPNLPIRKDACTIYHENEFFLISVTSLIKNHSGISPLPFYHQAI